MSLPDIEYAEDPLSESFISYYLKDNNAHIHNIYIEEDNLKSYVLFLVKFCKELTDKKIKNVVQIANKKDYIDNKDLYSGFTVKNVKGNDEIIELSTAPESFKFASMKALGF
jgi:hypothetical protein